MFLDRDDTLIHCTDVTPDGDLGDPSLVRLREGAPAALRRLKALGYRLIVVSNQGGVARGRYGVGDVERVHRRINDLLGGMIDDFRFCPFHPRGSVPAFAREHHWRKPAPGMLLDAAAHWGIDLSASWMIGDKERDCQAGRAAGCRTILLAEARPEEGTCAERVAPSLEAAAAIIAQTHEEGPARAGP